MDLKAAAIAGNKDAVQSLLNESTDVNTPDALGRTPLSWASQYGHEEVVRLFLERSDVHLNLLDNIRRSPLSWAAQYGQKKVVEHILARLGKDGIMQECDSPDEFGRTPLSLVAGDSLESSYHEREWTAWTRGDPPQPRETERLAIANLLIKTKADPQSTDTAGRTPLHWASLNGQQRLVGVLLENRSVHPDPKDNSGCTPLFLAAENGQHGTVRLLLDGNKNRGEVTIDSQNNAGWTPLSSGAYGGHWEVVDILTSRGANPNARADDDRTPLSLAAEKGRRYTTKLLMERGANPDSRDKNGRTPAHWVIEGYPFAGDRPNVDTNDTRAEAIISYLLENGAQPDSKDNENRTPLQRAIEKRVNRVALTLLSETRFYSRTSLSWPHVIQFLQRDSEAGVLNFFEEDAVLEKPEVGNAKLRQIFFFANSSPWENRWIPNLEYDWPHGLTMKPIAQKLDHFTLRQGSYPSNRYLVSAENQKDNQQCATFTLVALAPLEELTRNDKFLENEAWGTLAITWTMVLFEGRWISVDHFSMLQIGMIPKDNVELVTHFLSSLSDKWHRLCERADDHLARRRQDQLEKKGLSDGFITHLAEDALAWTQLRNILKDQTHALDIFTNDHYRRYSNKKGRDAMQKTVRHFSKAVETRLDSLDQTVKDLLQLEFAWVSVVEAHRSTSLSMSMKRLSWITLIFLPPMFASSLFGMNVDVLASNPDWRWYPVFGVAFLLVTLAGWLTFKSVEPRAKQRLSRIGTEFNKRFRKGGTRTGSASDIEMNPFN